MGLQKKIDFVEIAKARDFVVGCNWNSKTSQNFQQLVLINKKRCFSKRNCNFFRNR